jgi:hypothetical protein
VRGAPGDGCLELELGPHRGMLCSLKQGELRAVGMARKGGGAR